MWPECPFQSTQDDVAGGQAEIRSLGRERMECEAAGVCGVWDRNLRAKRTTGEGPRNLLRNLTQTLALFWKVTQAIIQSLPALFNLQTSVKLHQTNQRNHDTIIYAMGRKIDEMKNHFFLPRTENWGGELILGKQKASHAKVHQRGSEFGVWLGFSQKKYFGKGCN